MSSEFSKDIDSKANVFSIEGEGAKKRIREIVTQADKPYIGTSVLDTLTTDLVAELGIVIGEEARLTWDPELVTAMVTAADPNQTVALPTQRILSRARALVSESPRMSERIDGKVIEILTAVQDHLTQKEQ